MPPARFCDWFSCGAFDSPSSHRDTSLKVPPQSKVLLVVKLTHQAPVSVILIGLDSVYSSQNTVTPAALTVSFPEYSWSPHQEELHKVWVRSSDG